MKLDITSLALYGIFPGPSRIDSLSLLSESLWSIPECVGQEQEHFENGHFMTVLRSAGQLVGLGPDCGGDIVLVSSAKL